MKKQLIIMAILLFVFVGCITTQAPPPQEIKITIDKAGDVQASTEDDSKVMKTMSVETRKLQFSHNVAYYEDTVYITLNISGISAEYLWKDFQLIRQQANKFNRIVFYMNSPGGSATQGMGLTDEIRIFSEEIRQLKKKGIEIIMEGRGLIASAAIPVFLMGDNRKCSKSTIFLIHPAAIFKWGIFTETLKDLESQSRMIRMLRENYVSSVASRTDLSEEKITDMMTEDTWFTAKQAYEWGFVDELI